ncbi:hypothetical protein BFW01_g5228 [Lasiodiplodia theobromae]|uniref:Uncharacterized protein n=1 Tax=Lasiodiplodia theobromae TaxID=45133 RepID=A0A5N5D358_9PEZI|nr:hypothetical protein DBV05_g9262 [Lasiodiplodia theobromae]KAF9634333.1 hypothetical protein BFW01_g5228 [Lasiodiplodia theobromae]
MDVRNIGSLFKRAGGGGGGAEGIVYIPPPSIGHEIGVMFGGIGAMILGMLLFLAWWRVYLKHEETKERKRVDDLRQRGLLKERVKSTSPGSNGNGREKAAA